MRQGGKTYRFIAKMLGILLQMPQNGKTRAKKGGDHAKYLLVQTYILRAVRMNQFITSTEIKTKFHLNIHASTIKRRLVDAKLLSVSPRNVPLLSQRNV